MNDYIFGVAAGNDWSELSGSLQVLVRGHLNTLAKPRILGLASQAELSEV